MDKTKKKDASVRQPMPEKPADIRRRNFEEVPLGYSAASAMAEAARCLQCKNPQCVQGCPVGIDIPGFIKQIAEGDFTAATRLLWQQNTLPALCGRVCPQEIQCEGRCILAKKGDAVAIGNLERFAADWERVNGTGAIPPVAQPTGKKVAVVGSGANPLLTGATEDLALNKWGYIEADPATGKTSKRSVWAGGDIVTGAATVILAMGAGRRAANSMHDYLMRGW